jgi:hypothetical protein
MLDPIRSFERYVRGYFDGRYTALISHIDRGTVEGVVTRRVQELLFERRMIIAIVLASSVFTGFFQAATRAYCRETHKHGDNTVGHRAVCAVYHRCEFVNDKQYDWTQRRGRPTCEMPSNKEF